MKDRLKSLQQKLELALINSDLECDLTRLEFSDLIADTNLCSDFEPNTQYARVLQGYMGSYKTRLIVTCKDITKSEQING